VKPGDIKYKDQNNDGVINENDAVMIGRWIAPFAYSVNGSVSYANVTLFVQGTGNAGGNGVKNSNYYWVDGDKKYSEVVRGRWTEATKNTATYPRMSSGANKNNFQYSDFWIYSTDRFNLSKVQLTYNLPKSLLQHTFMRELGIYASGANLLTISKNREILELNVSSAPQYRYYNIGINAKF
jgi:hypothetical protein